MLKNYVSGRAIEKIFRSFKLPNNMLKQEVKSRGFVK